MRALLNTLGATVWGLIAIILAGALATLSYRLVSTISTNSVSGPPASLPPAAEPAPTPNAQPAAPTPSLATPLAPRTQRSSLPTIESMRADFDRASADQQSDKVVQYGEQLFEAGGATADDLTLIGHFVYLRRDCPNALLWSDRAVSAARSLGQSVPQEVYAIRSQCAAAVRSAARSPPPAAPKPSGRRQEISRIIAKEITQAQKDLDR